MPEWKNSEDTIFASIQESGAVELCVEEMLSHMLQDKTLIARLADEVMKSPEARDVLADAWMAEKNGGEIQGSPSTALRVPDAVYDKLVVIMGEELSQLVSETVWNQLDPKQGYPPASFLSACVRDAALRYYDGRAPYPDLKSIPAEMIESGGIPALLEGDESNSLQGYPATNSSIPEEIAARVNGQEEETVKSAQLKAGLSEEAGKAVELVTTPDEQTPAESEVNPVLDDIIREMTNSIVEAVDASVARNGIDAVDRMEVDMDVDKKETSTTQPAVDAEGTIETCEDP